MYCVHTHILYTHTYRTRTHIPHPTPPLASPAGEIIPQAFCARFGLAIGAYSSWLVRVLIVVCWVIAYPISKVLDWLLGHNQAVGMCAYGVG